MPKTAGDNRDSFPAHCGLISNLLRTMCNPTAEHHFRSAAEVFTADYGLFYSQLREIFQPAAEIEYMSEVLIAQSGYEHGGFLKGRFVISEPSAVGWKQTMLADCWSAAGWKETSSALTSSRAARHPQWLEICASEPEKSPQ